jgi:17beta-estradiol 17-dehydrogenase / very-long-chain 3-oxoacyl-CoA reductase
VNVSSYGKWAIVTGGSDGIGKAYGFELAKKGMNVLLIARSQENLSKAQNEIQEAAPNAQVETFVLDFSDVSEEKREELQAFLEDNKIEPGMLVNNVGISYEFPMYFDEVDDDRVHKLMEVNCASTVWMTKLVLPGMLQRKRGAIINISSLAGVVTSPLLAEYSAAKSFVEAFTRGLAAEYAGRGLDITCQIPLFVTTKLAKIRKASFFTPTPQTYVKAALKTLKDGPVVSPYFPHRMQLALMRLMPAFLQRKLVFNMHADLRKRGMAKRKRKEEESS